MQVSHTDRSPTNHNVEQMSSEELSVYHFQHCLNTLHVSCDNASCASCLDLNTSLNSTAKDLGKVLSEEARVRRDIDTEEKDWELTRLVNYGSANTDYVKSVAKLQASMGTYDGCHSATTQPSMTLKQVLGDLIDTVLSKACEDYAERYANFRQKWTGTRLVTRDEVDPKFVMGSSLALQKNPCRLSHI